MIVRTRLETSVERVRPANATEFFIATVGRCGSQGADSGARGSKREDRTSELWRSAATLEARITFQV